MLVIPTTEPKHGEAAFCRYAAQLWNRLPDHIKGAPTVSYLDFKLQLFSETFRELMESTLLYYLFIFDPLCSFS